MTWYIIKRLLSLIPVLLITSILAFFLSNSVPQDPVESYLLNMGGGIDKEDLAIEDSPDYKRASKLLGYDKALFYLSMVPHYYPRDYYNLSQTKIDQLKSGSFFLPSIRWHGTNNQYHLWFSNVLKMDFGNSLTDGRSVSNKIYKALSWTSLLVIISLVMIFLIGIPIGVYLSKADNPLIKNIVNYALYVLFAIPVFWLATIMLVFFTTDDYGEWTNIFPSVGIVSGSISFLEKIELLILPVIILCLHSAAYISRQTKTGLENQYKQAYTKTAFSKGLNQDGVLYRHNLKNALLPLITIGTDLIPSLFSGSLILEVIFNIPGVGRLLFNSIQLADWNIVFALLLVIAVITVISFLLGDLLYKIANPRIQLV